ncbi:DNA repair protein RadC [Novosphingobium sp. PhB57]|jgi:DNA repair protein RadC|uniref:JAB domain-containing protein n=1 Tax=unclassified Novosphingobium TaxID=2644732 RepID=UPI0010F07F0D|nr:MULTISPECIES: JAB domain-containing protein [unclassified Novosphingobium]TCU59854.1 DNA repair protein RadC [Novosphingobium sp. PhB57]TDW62655.1 DNA repair protein RadC [Novosphingobium sp. PhB55]
MLELPFDAEGRLVGQVACTTGCEATIRAGSRSLLQRVLEHRAVGLVLVHNHPSGDPLPSRADVIATRRLSALCETARIELHDHLVVGGRSAVSMRRAGLMSRAVT